MYHKSRSYKAQQTEFFIILGHFLPIFASLTTQRIKILKKWKKLLEILSFYTCVPKITIIWCRVPEIRSERQTFCHFAPFFALLSPNDPKKQNFKKMKKTPGDIILLHMCTINEDHMIYGSWNIRHNRQNFLSFWAIFALSPPPQTPPQRHRKSRFWTIEKNIWRCYHFVQVDHKWQSYDVWFLRYGAWQTEFFVTLDCFFPFYPPNNTENQNFEKMKKAPGDIIILHMCTKNHNHMMYSSWDTEWDRQIFLAFCTIFCTFIP